MKYIKQLGLILFILFIGEIIKNLTSLPVPGNIIGMILLFILLKLKVVKLSQVEEISAFFMTNIAFFFIPAGISLIGASSYLSGSLLKIGLIILISTILVLSVTAVTVEFLIKVQTRFKKIENKKMSNIENKTKTESKSKLYKEAR